MLIERILLCLYCILFIAQTKGEDDKKRHVDYKVSNYFFNSNYQCYATKIFPDASTKWHIRRCKINYKSPNLYSPRCIHCPIPCSLCARVLTDYTFGTTKSTDEGREDEHCYFHSIDRIEPRKIRAKAGKTFIEDVRCVAKRFCGENPCQNGGSCHELYYSYICICEKEFYGKNCNIKISGQFVGKLSNGVQIWFPLEGVAARLVPFFVTVAQEGEAQVIQVSTASGYTVRLTEKDKIKNFPQNCQTAGCRCKYEEGCKSAYSGTLLFDNHYIKHKFKNLPVLFAREAAIGFVSSVKLRVFNEKFSKVKPVVEETIQSFTRLRFQTMFLIEITPDTPCSMYAVKDTSTTKFNPGLQGDCRSSFDNKITIHAELKLQVSFFLKFVGLNWQMYKAEADSRVKDLSETGYFTIHPGKILSICKPSTTAYEYRWRFYKMDGLHKMTDKTEANAKFETKYMKCENTESKRIHDEENRSQVCKIKIDPNIEPGDYMFRLTTIATTKTSGKPSRIMDNFQMNYYCYYHVVAAKRDFVITGESVINKCLVNIDTKGYGGEGELIWTCTVTKGPGPCPDNVARNHNKESLSKVMFKDGEYDVCVDWLLRGTSVRKPCVKVVAKDCDKKPKDEPQAPDLTINCRENCDLSPDPDSDIRLGVVDRNTGRFPEHVTYIIKDSKGKTIPLKDVTKRVHVRKNEIRIDLEKLEPDQTYTVIAKVGNIDTPPYTIRFSRIPVPEGGNCTLQPKEGIRGVTLFDIECFGWQADGPILYEFFDKGPEDVEHYDGRMITYSYSGILSKFRLTRGNVVIYLMNEDGVGPNVNMSVKLTDFNNDKSHLNYLVEEIDNYMDYDNYQLAMDIMSTAAEILAKDMDNDDYIRKLISKMYKVKYNSAESMKLGLSTIQSILVNGTIQGMYKIDDVEQKQTGKILTNIAHNYLKYATKPDQTPRFRAKHINQLSRIMMDCVDMSIVAQNRTVSKLGPEQDVNYDVMDNWNEASNDLAESLMVGMYMAGRAHVYADPGLQITSPEQVTDMWTWVNNAEDLVNVAGNNMSSFVNISSDLAKRFNPNHDLMLQFALMNKNMFWWSQNNINTEVLMVGLAEKMYRPGYYYVPRVPVPVQIFMKVQNLEKTTLAGTVTQLDPTLDTDTLDRNILVHRFVLPPLSKLFITFKFGNAAEQSQNGTDDIAKRDAGDVGDTGAAEGGTEGPAEPVSTEELPVQQPAEGSTTEGPASASTGTPASSLRVLIYYSLRPDWEDMKNAKEVTPENPYPDVPYDITEREHFYYMGILPDKSVPVNESVSYTFDIHYINCHVWQNQWVNHYCLVGPETTHEMVECQCTHLSIFSSSIFIPPNDINPVLDAPLFLTVAENWYVVVFVLVILLLFLLLLIWAYVKDRKDALSSNVIVLHDNFPGENYAYLIAIFTGSRLMAGTSAAVGLRLYGDSYASRPTILKAEKRKVLQRDQDDWFLLTYPVSLGILNAVQLWHNSEGRGPDWFCSKVIVYDLPSKTQYLFVVDQWLAMEVDEYPEAMVRPATSDEVLNVKRIFLDNSVMGLRENHLHLSVFTRHPRSPVGRKQRLVVLMVLIMSAMLASIMFFNITDTFAKSMDEFEYSVGEREVVISVQSLIISTVFAFVALFLFRKGYKERAVHTQHTTLFMPTKRSEETDKYWLSEKPIYVDLTTFVAFDEKRLRHRRDMTTWEAFVAAVRKWSHQDALRPVRLADAEEEIRVNTPWLTAAWVFSIAVILMSAYLVMLYSLKFGKIKSLKWLSSLVAGQLEDIFLFTPLKIMLTATLMSVAFERSTDVTAFSLDVKKAIKHDLLGDKEYLKSLIELRTMDIYNPMTDEMKAKRRRRAIRKMKWWIIFDLIAVVTYVLVLCYVMKSLWSGSTYWPNAHASDIIMTTFHGRFTALQDVYNRTQFFDYMQNTFVRSIFVFRWYNDLHFQMLSPPSATSRKDWTKDYVSKLLGAPRLRQLRVYPRMCPLMTMKHCTPPWSERNMDTDVYGIKWEKADFMDEITYSWGYRTYWTYTAPSNTSVFPLAGKSGIAYPTGGYIMPLFVKRDESKTYTTLIQQEHWVDERMRAVFLELTLFNANTHLYSQVTAIVEQMTSGLYLTTASVDTVQTQAGYSILTAVYIVFIIALIIRIAYNVNRNGLVIFFMKRLNCYEVLVVVISILSVVFYIIHLKESAFYVDKFNRDGIDNFFNFRDMIVYFRYMRVLLWVLFCLLVFRVFVSWYFGPTFVAFYNTFYSSRRWIGTLMVTLLLSFLLIWRFIGYTMDGKVFYNYRVNILHYKMYSNIFRRDFQSRTKIVALALCFLTLFFQVLFVMLFTHYYRVGKRTKLKPMQYFNILTFVIGEIRRCFGKQKEERIMTDRAIHRKMDIEVPKG